MHTSTRDLSAKMIPNAFMECVRDCARSEHIVATFNHMFGFELAAPIERLLQTHDVRIDRDPDEGLALACFIAFVHLMIWRPSVQRVARRFSWARMDSCPEAPAI